ncbi:hypothetical protein P261_00626 [Lachnospiraceae bacterium TWA4]|nr:hypothetical protein P261_00626 [Lachnospiraceae bacterium TWA4]
MESKKDYELKFATSYYLNFKPSGKQIEILGGEGSVAYAYFNNNYYEFPIQSYNYIVEQVEICP